MWPPKQAASTCGSIRSLCSTLLLLLLLAAARGKRCRAKRYILRISSLPSNPWLRLLHTNVVLRAKQQTWSEYLSSFFFSDLVHTRTSTVVRSRGSPPCQRLGQESSRSCAISSCHVRHTKTKQNLMLLAHWSRTCAQARRDLAGWLADWLADTCRTGKLAADGQGAQPVHVGQMPGTRDIDLFCLFVCLAAPHGHGSASSKWQ